MIAIGGAAAAAIGFGALFSSLAGSGEGPDRFAQNSLSLSLGGFQLSQIIIAILGVALVAGEYQSGLIRTWFGAAPDRLRVLGAKVVVYGGLVFVVSLVAAVVAFLAGQALLPVGWEAADARQRRRPAGAARHRLLRGEYRRDGHRARIPPAQHRRRRRCSRDPC